MANDDDKPSSRGTILLVAHVIALTALLAYLINR